jgi:archaeosine-15-forming tRNA-guanine transglycosylase
VTDWLRKLRVIADYWFGKGAGEKLISGDVKIIYGTTKRPRQVWERDKRLFSIRAEDFYFILAWGALKIKDYLHRINIKLSSLEKRSSIFPADIERIEGNFLPGENVLIMHKETPLAVGIAKISSEEAKTVKFGEVVKIKEKFERARENK